MEEPQEDKIKDLTDKLCEANRTIRTLEDKIYHLEALVKEIR